MPLGDLYEQDNLRALQVMVDLPPPPPQPQRTWNGWSTMLRGAAAGINRSAAALSDVIKGYGAASAITLEADPIARAALGDQAVEAGAAEGRRQIATGEALSSDLGRSFRAGAGYWRNDPATAGKAEQMFFDLSAGLTQAVVHGVLMGPAAPVTFGTDVALNTAADLEEQGVDPATGMKVAGVAGTVNALGFMIPAAGRNWMQTLALGAIAGPGSFVTQQIASREILKSANYGELAQQFDPLDPYTFTASMLPFGFGALAMRGARAKPITPGQKPPTPHAAEPTARPSLQPEQVDAVMTHNLTLQADAHEAMPMGRVASEAWREQVTGAPEFRNWFGESKAVDAEGRPAALYHDTTTSLDGMLPPDEQGPQGLAFFADRAAAAPGATRAPGSLDLMPVYVKAERPLIVPSDGFGDPVEALMARAPEIVQAMHEGGHDSVIVVRSDGEGPRLVAVPDLAQVRSALPDRELLASLAPRPAEPMPFEPAAVEPVARAVAAGRATREQPGMPFEISNAGRQLGEAVAHLQAGADELGGDALRVSRMLADFARSTHAMPDRPLPEIAAGALDAARRGETLTPYAEPDLPAPGSAGDPTTASVKARLHVLEHTRPDLMIRLTEGGEPITLADELARVRREAREGTDTELGTLDAQLVRVAAECALMAGGV